MTDTDRPDHLRTKIFGERVVYDNEWIRVALVDIEPPDGRRFEHHVVRLQTVVLTLVVDDQDRVLLLWRHRFATNEWGWELPGGILGQAEEPSEAAVREVVEETGWRPGSVEHLATFQPMPGMVDTPHQVFVGRNAVWASEPTDLEEAGRVEWIPLSAATELAAKGQLLGSGSLVGLLFYMAKERSSATP